MPSQSLAEYLGISLHPRQKKPRDRGRCMIIDTGYGPKVVETILEQYGHLIDIAKLTELHLTVPVELMRDKIALYRNYDIRVQPGGIVLELARLQGRGDVALEKLREVGFNLVEVSSSATSQREQEEEAAFVRNATAAGFEIVGEVGKKFHYGDRTRKSDKQLDVEETVREMKSLLGAGASKVYWEGHVLRRIMGDTAADILSAHPDSTHQIKAVADQVGAENIIFEVSSMIPYVHRRAQQFWLVRLFGPEVNIGNVRLDEVQFLEHIRLGTWPVFGFGELGDHPFMRALESAGEGEISPTWWQDIPVPEKAA